MSDRIVPTGGREDPFFQVWQRVTGTSEGEQAEERPPVPEISLNEWLQRLLRQTEQREGLCRAWQSLHRFLPLCRREREVLAAAFFLRTGMLWQGRGPVSMDRDLLQDCRKLCLLFAQSGAEYDLAAQSVEGRRLREQFGQFAESCRRAGEETEGLLQELLKRRGYI